MAWYRIHRPRQIADLNITSVREALQKMMQSGKVPQALLFAGPKGTGKTSASRILGAMLNDPANADLVDHLFFKKKAPKKLSFVEPDGNSDFARLVYEGHSFVVQELDAASNRRIDDIRLLKERIHLPPTEGKMTVYILDEVHMLTTEAFNALLKILEEPPAHVVFILATTELHKIPATIVSRCSIVNFRRAQDEELSLALARVLEKEGIAFEPKDLVEIVTRADGSFRDGVKILEMACQGGSLDLASIKNLLASDTTSYIKKIIDQVMQKDELSLAQTFLDLRENNYDQRDFYKDFFSFLHHDLLINLGVVEGKATHSALIDQFFLRELLAAQLDQESPIAFLALELKMLEIIARSKKTPAKPSAMTQNSSPEKEPANQEAVKMAKKKIEKSPVSPALKEATSVAAKPTPETAETPHNLKEIWQKIITSFAKENFSLQTLLKSCKLDSVNQSSAVVSVYYSFHKEQLEQSKNKNLLSQVAGEILGNTLNFNFVLREQSELDREVDLVLAAKDSLL